VAEKAKDPDVKGRQAETRQWPLRLRIDLNRDWQWREQSGTKSTALDNATSMRRYSPMPESYGP